VSNRGDPCQRFHCQRPNVSLNGTDNPYNLVARVNDHAALFREGLEAVSGNEPGSLDLILVEHLEQAADADGARKEATGDVRSAVLAAVAAEPAGYGVNVD